MRRACCTTWAAKGKQPHNYARANIDAWDRGNGWEMGLDAILITTSGCGTTVKDYGFMFRNEPEYADKAASLFSAIAKDISEYLGALRLRVPAPADPKGQIPGLPLGLLDAARAEDQRKQPKRLLTTMEASWSRRSPEGHICCGSAGVYNILQPEICGATQARKVANIEKAADHRHGQYRLHHSNR